MGGTVVILLSYLLGSISFSIVIARLIAGIDIREHGSGNAGATNTLRMLGKGPGITVLLLDAAKGAIAITIARLLGVPEWAIVGAAVAAVLGHNWPIFFGFKGGKGVATTIGTLLALTPLPALIGVGITIVVIALTRYVSLGSLVFFVLVPFLMYLYHEPGVYIAGAAFVGLLGFIRHTENISRLIKGDERKLGQKKQEEKRDEK